MSRGPCARHPGRRDRGRALYADAPLHAGGGDLTKVNIPKGDKGGGLDPHGVGGNGASGARALPLHWLT